MSKYLSKKIEYNGMIFDSKKECKRYKELEKELEDGAISDLKCQVKYLLIPAQRGEDGKVVERECSYKADFEYLNSNGEKVVEDVKGYRKGQAYALFTIKRKLMLSVHGIKVVEI